MQKNSYPYPVEFAEDIFGESTVLADLVRKVTSGREKPRAFLVADMNVVQHTEGLGLKIGRWAQAQGIELAGAPVVLPGSEKIKCDDQVCVRMTEGRILKAGLGANDVVLAIGGGSLLDVANVAAAHVRGGVPVVRIPTTGLAMVAAAFSDTAATNVAGSKDVIRVRSVPAAVVIDPSFAKTVLDGVWRSGYGAALCYALAMDVTLFKKLEALRETYMQRDEDAMRKVINLTVTSRLKRGDTNFGMWGALKLEGLSGYKVPHGCAVPIGACLDLRYAFEAGMLKDKDYGVAFGALERAGLLEPLFHSRHLLSQHEAMLAGLDAWSLTADTKPIDVPCGIGKTKPVESPDREIYEKVFQKFSTYSHSR